MSDPTLKTTSALIRYTASDGYRAEITCKNVPGLPQLPPEQHLLNALEELARITALFGFEDKAAEVFVAARARVAEWKIARDDATRNTLIRRDRAVQDRRFAPEVDAPTAFGTKEL